MFQLSIMSAAASGLIILASQRGLVGPIITRFEQRGFVVLLALFLELS